MEDFHFEISYLCNIELFTLSMYGCYFYYKTREKTKDIWRKGQ